MARVRTKDNAEDARELPSNPWIAEASILVVDDEPGMRNFLVRTLSSRCKHVMEASNTIGASCLLTHNHFDLIILDNIMAGKSGVDWLEEQRAAGYSGDVILITAYADLETAIRAIRAGAVDFVIKPFRANQILNAISRCLDRARLLKENFVLRHELRSHPSGERARSKLVGNSPAIHQVRELLGRVAPLPTTVLLTGESGTGKEVTARTLHGLSDRADKPFVPVNCAAIAPDIIESELFGHMKGAFTGANSSREGLFFYAQGGTLFLDEIGELPPATQSKLLRVIEDKRIRPVGAEREIRVDVRLVSATNANLEVAVAEGKFRQDLFYRLNVMRIHLPPLRERTEDVQMLAQMFMDQISADLGFPQLDFSPGILAHMENYSWPGNVRELRNFIERSLILGRFPSEIDDVENNSYHQPQHPQSQGLAAIEKQHILKILESCGGNRAEAARRLGVSRKTLDRKCTLWNV